MRDSIVMIQLDACSSSVAYRPTYKFTGKERDAESGIDNYGAKYYASTFGRFGNPDPSNLSIDWRLSQTWNRYQEYRNRRDIPLFAHALRVMRIVLISS